MTQDQSVSTRLCERAVIRVESAEDGAAIAFLQGLVTSDLAGPLPVWTALLSPQGKVLFDFLVWPSESGLLLDCEAEHAEELVRRLSLYRLRRPIDMAVDTAVAVHWTAHAGDGGAADPRLGALGQRWLAPAGDADAAAGCADAAWRAHRLALGVPEGRAELGHDQTLWLECNAAELHGVSFTKGCYIGQENTARMNWRQKINRRVLVVPLEQSNADRQRIAYPDLGVAIDHLRVADADPALFPGWLSTLTLPASDSASE